MYLKVQVNTPQPDTQTPKNNFGKKYGPCDPDQCYGAAFGVLRPPTVYITTVREKNN